MTQLELPDRTWLEIGDRVIELAALPSHSRKCGTIVEFRHMSGREGLYPVVRWDNGSKTFSSYEWGLRKLADNGQLALF
ncbi:hypothetical protein [Pantanalinema sp. GBBB05]|uniref:hypothetical protein n=1 Tax=Pantanalinema sp. GBBB05 TaxID=2604139 RepID=UPI001DE16504|nr:hypothetical protein [Pantanalinema sp. GBBB05]